MTQAAVRRWLRSAFGHRIPAPGTPSSPAADPWHGDSPPFSPYQGWHRALTSIVSRPKTRPLAPEVSGPLALALMEATPRASALTAMQLMLLRYTASHPQLRRAVAENRSLSSIEDVGPLRRLDGSAPAMQFE